LTTQFTEGPASAPLLSSDSHVVEPGDLWVERLPAHLRDRAPRAIKDPVSHYWYFNLPGQPRGVNLTLSVTAGFTRAEVDDMLAEDPDAVPGVGGGSDPVARLGDLWRDGVLADVLYPTAGLSLLSMEDTALAAECFDVYNRWLSEFCSVDPARLLGLALVPCNDIARGVRVLEEAKAGGLVGGLIWTAPPEGDSFFDPRYEPLWAAAEALEMPLSVHTLGGQRPAAGCASWAPTCPPRSTWPSTTARSSSVRCASWWRPASSSATRASSSSAPRRACISWPRWNAGWTVGTRGSGEPARLHAL